MARATDWIAVTIKNKKTHETMTLFHPPTLPRAGETVDRRLRRLLERAYHFWNIPDQASSQEYPGCCRVGIDQWEQRYPPL